MDPQGRDDCNKHRGVIINLTDKTDVGMALVAILAGN